MMCVRANARARNAHEHAQQRGYRVKAHDYLRRVLVPVTLTAQLRNTASREGDCCTTPNHPSSNSTYVRWSLVCLYACMSEHSTPQGPSQHRLNFSPSYSHTLTLRFAPPHPPTRTLALTRCSQPSVEPAITSTPPQNLTPHAVTPNIISCHVSHLTRSARLAGCARHPLASEAAWSQRQEHPECRDHFRSRTPPTACHTDTLQRRATTGKAP